MAVESNPAQTPTPKQLTSVRFPLRFSFFIAALVTLASFFTYYLPDNLPDFDGNGQPDFGVLADAETNYDFFRFIGGTYVGALLALLGGSELVNKFKP